MDREGVSMAMFDGVPALVSTRLVPRAAWRDEFHALPIGSGIGLVVCAALALVPTGVFIHLLTGKVWVAAWGWIPLAAMLLVATAVPLWIARLLWEEVRAALRASNWQVRLSDDALWVQVRSWRNWRLGADDAQVMRIPWSAVEAVWGAHEEWRVLPKAGVRRRFKSQVVLQLRASAETEPLQRAVTQELHRTLVHPDFVSGATIWNDVPAFFDTDQNLRISRVEMSLLRSIARRVPRRARVAQVRTVGQEFAFQPIQPNPQDLADLVLRGEWGLAQMTAQFRGGMSYDDSVALIRRLFEPGGLEVFP